MLTNPEPTSKTVKFLIYVCIICAGIATIFSFSFHGRILDQLKLKPRYTTPTPMIHKRNCTVIVHNPLGRLGNVLFEFASAYGLSLEHSCHLYIGPNMLKQLNEYFEIHLSNLLTKSELNRTSPIRQLYSHCTFFPDLFQENTSQHIELTGYWQVEKHFRNQTDQIREQLQFKQTILTLVKNFIQTNVSDNVSQLVGVHIRRGDFIGQRTVSSNKFLFDAMDYFERKYNTTKFIFVSDDKPYCRQTFGNKTNTYFTPDSFSQAEDMAVITLCHHAIITVGTYGWWGAYLLQNKTGEVITDSKPNHDPLDVDCKGSVYFPTWFKFINSTR